MQKVWLMKVKDTPPVSIPKFSSQNVSLTVKTSRRGGKRKIGSARKIESTFRKLGLETYQNRARFLHFADESSQALSPGYITYISGGSMLSAQAS